MFAAAQRFPEPAHAPRMRVAAPLEAGQRVDVVGASLLDHVRREGDGVAHGPLGRMSAARR